MTFMLVGSFSMFFMCLFFVAGVLTTKIQRNVTDETDEMKHLKGYVVASAAGLFGGSISLISLAFL